MALLVWSAIALMGANGAVSGAGAAPPSKIAPDLQAKLQRQPAASVLVIVSSTDQ
jgi:hypothetical protein